MVESLEKELKEQSGWKGETLAKYRVAFAVRLGVSWEFERSWNCQKDLEVTDIETYAEKNLWGIFE